MVTIDEFSRLVSSIYAAAVTPGHWAAAIRDIHQAFGGAHGALLVTDGARRSIISSTASIEAGKSYVEHYHRLDYVLAAVEKGPVGVVRTGSELTDPQKHPEFHAEWARPFNADDGLVARLTDGPQSTCFVIGASRRSEWFDTPERVKVMSALVPHLQQALRTQERLTADTASRSELAGALDAARNGVIIVSLAQRVTNLNSAAEHILRAEDGLGVRSGRLTPTDSRAKRELQHAIHLALTGDRSSIRRGHSFACERPSGKRPYLVHVLPLHRRRDERPQTVPVALVIVVDPERGTEPPAALLRRLYGLTKSEAEVAVRIARGADPRQISDDLAVSSTTVRTHLRHVFDKTDTHRQAELVRLLLTLNP